jgi:hypothetical protein
LAQGPLAEDGACRSHPCNQDSEGYLPVKVVMANVLGHQDDEWLFFEELELLSQTNVKMDNRANDYLQQVLALDTIPCCPPTIAYKGWHCIMVKPGPSGHLG